MHRLIDGKKISTTVWPVPALLLDIFNPMEKPWRSPEPPGPCLHWELQGTRLKVVGVINQLVACGPLVRCVSCTVTRPTMWDTGYVWRKMIWHSWDRESMFSGFVVSGEWVRPHAPGLLYTSQPLHDGWLLTWWCGWHAVCGNAITMTMTIVHNSEVFKINFCWEISYIIISYNIYIEQKHSWTMLSLCFLRNARCLWPTSTGAACLMNSVVLLKLNHHPKKQRKQTQTCGW